MAKQDHAARKDDVALALVHDRGLADVAVAAGPEPVQIRRGLRRALLVLEVRTQDFAPDNGRAVGREDHVRQAWFGVDRVHGVTEACVRLAQALPLLHGERHVYWLL